MTLQRSKSSPPFLMSKLWMIIFCFLLFVSGHAEPVKSLNETVALENFSPKIYEQNISTYLLESDDPDFSLLNSPFQKTISSGVHVGKKTITLSAGVDNGRKVPPENRSPLLKNTRFLCMNDPSIAACSRQFHAAKNPLLSVEIFVHNTISHKVNGIPLLPAANILKNKTGDCTEHSVLAVALLRSIGIPARAVVGMVLAADYSGLRDVFVFHMWAEAWHRGRWHLVDATTPGEKNAGRYVAFAYHSLKTETPVSYLQTLAAIQNLKVRFIK